MVTVERVHHTIQGTYYRILNSDQEVSTTIFWIMIVRHLQDGKLFSSLGDVNLGSTHWQAECRGDIVETIHFPKERTEHLV